MRHKDLLQRFLFENLPIRGELAHLEKSYQTIINQHNYPPAIRRLLGEALVISVLLSATIKFNGRLTVQFRGKGNLKLLLAQCTDQFQIRGLAQWDGDVSYEDLMNSFEEGILAIMLDSPKSKSPYQGVVSWKGNSLVESIEHYFKHSEQLITKLWLAVTEKEAAGLLLQVVPGADKAAPKMEKDFVDFHWDALQQLSSTLQSDELLHLDHLTLLRRLYPEQEVRVFPSVPIEFRCTCSLERSEEAIALLGREEAEEELRDKQKIIVTCDFCSQEYIFDRSTVEKIFAKKTMQSNHKHLH